VVGRRTSRDRDVIPAHSPPIVASARIAIVEDDDAIRALIADLLGEEAYCCLAGSSLESGVELLERQQPGLLILDIVLGARLDGCCWSN
jgi:DNA-binding response OmpR family regulator